MKKIAILLLFITTFGFGTIINVPDDAWSIQNGIDIANNGDTILVRNGLYIENINWSMTDNICLIGSNMDSTIIDGGNNGKVIDNSDETSHPIEISNLTIQMACLLGKGDV